MLGRLVAIVQIDHLDTIEAHSPKPLTVSRHPKIEGNEALPIEDTSRRHHYCVDTRAAVDTSELHRSEREGIVTNPAIGCLS